MYALCSFEEHICSSKMQRKMRKNSGVKKITGSFGFEGYNLAVL